MLKQLGKISKTEIADAEVNDMPPHFRLACQYIIRDEDIVVKFAGDETIPAKPSQRTGRHKINDYGGDGTKRVESMPSARKDSLPKGGLAS